MGGGKLVAWLAAVSMLVLANVCRADGFIVIHNPPAAVPGHFAFAPLQVTYHHVTAKVDDQVAVTAVDEEFYNPNPQRLEGTYLFPLPAGSHIDKFEMDINGQMQSAELLPADKARSLYEEIVRKYRDPALLEYMGRDAFKVRIFPIEPNGRKRIKLQYTQLLKSDSGLVEYAYPLNTEKFSSAPLRDVSVTLELNCRDPIKSVYSPSHNVRIKREGDRRATIEYEQHDVRPDTDFKLIFSRTKSPVGIDLLTCRNGADDGYFLLLASPGMEAPRGRIEKKDICFVLDTSGSMAGAKIEQARKALSFCLNNLNDGDRFEVMRFSTETEPLFNELVPADKPHVEKALSFVKDLKAIGGTAIGDALAKALNLRSNARAIRREAPVDLKDLAEQRPYVIVFLTDGLPTVGDTSEDSIVSQAANRARGGAKIFCFGIGNDVNTHLLDRIAEDTHAASAYVMPEEDIEVKVGTFYTKIREPVLSNVAVSFSGSDVKVSQVYPSAMPDLYKGEMLVAFGRYSGHGPAAAKITGTFNGQPQTFANDVNFSEKDTGNEFIPRLWATRRVGWLLDEIRMHGESKELKDEVTKLAREHGIVTPYTAYLILEDETHRNVPVARQTLRELSSDHGVVSDASRRFDQARSEAQVESRRSGASAVAAAKDVADLKQASNSQQYAAASQNEALRKPSMLPAAGTATTQPAYGYRVATNYSEQARVINGRAFYQNGSVWTDARAQSQQNVEPRQIAFMSEDYFELLKGHPEAASWLALGTEVDLVVGDTLYQVR
jgi:Ca-activated chloride channel family protein